ncbi:MAG: NAD-dependent epimerase/dehydratase family protein [Deltaproteobacteria bacterium]|nr:NAD-dependent epimerase/dehydratase family protein [Deltaproteobacteria bacterium]
MFEKFENRRIIVTGGLGFIGSHLIRRLESLRLRELVILDNFGTGSLENLGQLPANVRVEKCHIGSTSASVLKSLLKDCDYLFHLAAEKHNQSLRTPFQLIDSNVSGTQALLEAAAENGVRKVVFSSSLYAYGRLRGNHMQENEATAPITVYGASKLFGENLLAHFSKFFGLKSITLRYFFVYGPKQYAGMGYKSVILKNFERILKDEAPIICGDGAQKLDYTYVEDIVEATLLAMESDISDEIINLGSGKGTSISELTTSMLQTAGKKLNPNYVEPDWTADTCRVANTEKATRLLKWSPKISLVDGLNRTYEWMKLRVSDEI